MEDQNVAAGVQSDVASEPPPVAAFCKFSEPAHLKAAAAIIAAFFGAEGYEFRVTGMTWPDDWFRCGPNSVTTNDGSGTNWIRVWTEAGEPRLAICSAYSNDISDYGDQLTIASGDTRTECYRRRAA